MSKNTTAESDSSLAESKGDWQPLSITDRKELGKLVLDVNASLLELLKVYSRGTDLSDKDIEKEERVKAETEELDKYVQKVASNKIDSLEKLLKSCAVQLLRLQDPFSRRILKM